MAQQLLRSVLHPSTPLAQPTLVEVWKRRTLSSAAGDVAAQRLLDLRDKGKL
ncbi:MULTISPECIES: hypothetical protein [unclassified Methylobacterium]|uniref:hypothetical protein n=1 Tax=unclassified Methylobacterium TaxID=2615210 RepID=UPI0002EF2834|nr:MULTISPECIES: hypothetical protein [Methylobacterium]WFT81540.1 hypothetical protein QA634_06560 [Methylobacterium nodulans]